MVTGRDSPRRLTRGSPNKLTAGGEQVCQGPSQALAPEHAAADWGLWPRGGLPADSKEQVPPRGDGLGRGGKPETSRGAAGSETHSFPGQGKGICRKAGCRSQNPEADVLMAASFGFSQGDIKDRRGRLL